MAITRVDTFTSTQKKQEYYSDFLDSFAKTPIGNELGRVTNEKSVNQSLKNLIKTNLGERLFQPLVGSDVISSLFELGGVVESTHLKFAITNTIKNNEPRINLLEVIIDYETDPNNIVVTLVYSLINSIDITSYNILLKRVR